MFNQLRSTIKPFRRNNHVLTQSPDKRSLYAVLGIVTIGVVTTSMFSYRCYQYNMVEKEPSKILNMILPSNDAIKFAVSKDYRLFTEIPESWITQELCDYVIRQNPAMYHRVPERFKTFDARRQTWISLLLRVPIHKLPRNQLTPGLLLSILNDNNCNVSTKYFALSKVIYDHKISTQTFPLPDIEYLRDHDVLHGIPSDIIKQFDLNAYNGLVLTGKQFNEHFAHLELNMLLDSQLQTVTNATGKFRLIGKYNEGTCFPNCPEDWDLYHKYSSKESHIEPTQIPNDALVRIESDGIIETNKLISTQRLEHE